MKEIGAIFVVSISEIRTVQLAAIKRRYSVVLPTRHCKIANFNCCAQTETYLLSNCSIFSRFVTTLLILSGDKILISLLSNQQEVCKASSTDNQCQTPNKPLFNSSAWQATGDKSSITFINPLTPKISLAILLTVYHTIHMILVRRIWYWIN